MIDEADIGFINTHPEGIRSHDYFGFAVHESFLDPFALRTFQPAVIEECTHALFIKAAHDRFRHFAGSDVDNARLFSPSDMVKNSLELLVFLLEMIDTQMYVRTVESANQNLWLRQVQALYDLFANLRRCRRSHGQNSRVPQPFDGN